MMLAWVVVVGARVGEPASGREVEAPEAVVSEPASGREVEAAEAVVSELPLGTGEREPVEPVRSAAIGRLHNYLGLVVDGAWERRTVGASAAGSQGAVTGGVGALGVMARLAGYGDKHPGGSRVIRMTMPELMLALEVGGSGVRRDAGAREQGVTSGAGLVGGGRGVANIGAAFASPGRVGVYAGVRVGQRFLARGNDSLEGAYYLASLGPGVGMRIAAPRRWTVLVGGALDGVLGVQRLNASRLVAQLAPAVDLGAYVLARPNVYVGVVGRGDRTVVGERYGGQRLHGRVTAEVVWKLRVGIRPRFAGVLVVYEGGRVQAAAGHPQFAAGGERRAGHHLLLAGGVTF